MTDDELTGYLANLVHISNVDGSLVPREARAIETVRREIGAREGHLERAIRLVAEDGRRPEPVGRLSDKVRNLEDMVWISLIDGEFHDSEKPEILSFAKRINMGQTQMDEILKEARCRIESECTVITCSSCAREIPENSKFCPFCGKGVGRE